MSSAELANFFESWDRIHKQTVKVIKVAPVEKYEWRPIESAMTLGELVRHLPEAERFLVGMITGQKVDDQDLNTLKSPDEIIAAFDQIHEACKKVVSALTENDLNESIQFGPVTVLKRDFLHGMCEHEIHHRGQLYTYVRLTGVVPPPLFGGM